VVGSTGYEVMHASKAVGRLYITLHPPWGLPHPMRSFPSFQFVALAFYSCFFEIFGYN
jgi:hypothetical protein